MVWNMNIADAVIHAFISVKCKKTFNHDDLNIFHGKQCDQIARLFFNILQSKFA